MDERSRDVVRRWQNGELANDSPEVLEELRRQSEMVSREGDEEEIVADWSEED